MPAGSQCPRRRRPTRPSGVTGRTSTLVCSALTASNRRAGGASAWAFSNRSRMAGGGERVHATLRPSTNVVLIVLWAALAALFAMLCRQVPLPALVVGAILGCIVGTLQFRSLKAAP